MLTLQVLIAMSEWTLFYWGLVKLAEVSEKLTASDILLIDSSMETVSSSETAVDIYQTTWPNVPEDSHLKY
jgi:hypothetical protein